MTTSQAGSARAASIYLERVASVRQCNTAKSISYPVILSKLRLSITAVMKALPLSQLHDSIHSLPERYLMSSGCPTFTLLIRWDKITMHIPRFIAALKTTSSSIPRNSRHILFGQYSLCIYVRRRAFANVAHQPPACRRALLPLKLKGSTNLKESLSKTWWNYMWGCTYCTIGHIFHIRRLMHKMKVFTTCFTYHSRVPKNTWSKKQWCGKLF